MKKIIFLLISSISIIACNSKKNAETYENFVSSISYVENNGSYEVRLNLPNGGSKIIHKFDEHIFESGKKCSYTTDTPFGGLNFLDGDTSFHLVNTSYAKTSRGRYNMIYIYQKNQNVLVYMEMLEIQGLVDSKILFKGNIFQTKSDLLSETEETYKTENEKKTMKFKFDENPNETIELVIDGKDVSMEFYQNDELVRMIKGTYSNNKFLMDDNEVEYVLNENNLCYHLEGNDYCYSKISERTIN